MSWTIDVIDVPFEGLAVEQDVLPSEIGLPWEDGRIRGLLRCTGCISFPDEHMATFRGTLKGQVVRECVRCLVEFEEEITCTCEVNFSRPSHSMASPASSKKSRKGNRIKNIAYEEQEDEIDAYPIIDQKIDLIPGLREHLILAAPLNPLCKEECEGLCQVCGANLNQSACACYAPVMPSSAFDVEGGSLLSKKALSPFSRTV